MTKGDKAFLAVASFVLVLGVVFATWLQPKQPNFAGDSGYQEQPTSYRAGGAGCEPAKVNLLPLTERQSKADACAQAQEQHREATDNLIENRRAAVASEGSAIYTAIQARIEAWGAAFGLLTLLAAIAAAYFAKKAADHTEESANIAREASRAWVACEDIVLLEPVKYENHPQLGPRYEIRADIILKNTGQALARRVFVHTRIVTGEINVFEPALANLKDAAETVIKTHYESALYRGLPLAPGQSAALRHGWGGPVPGHPTLEQVHGGAFYILGYVSYLDHFGRPQSSVFAFHPDADSVRPWDDITMVRAGAIGDAT